jgi:hypothetical protein
MQHGVGGNVWPAVGGTVVSAVSEVSGFLSLFPTRAQAGFVIGDGGVEWNTLWIKIGNH